MERVVKKSRSFREADTWDLEQQSAMTPRQRMAAAQLLKQRVYPTSAKDVREWHRSR